MFIYELNWSGFEFSFMPTYLPNIPPVFCKHIYQSFTLRCFLIRAMFFNTARSLIWTSQSNKLPPKSFFNSMEKFLILGLPKKVLLRIPPPPQNPPLHRYWKAKPPFRKWFLEKIPEKLEYLCFNHKTTLEKDGRNSTRM